LNIDKRQNILWRYEMGEGKDFDVSGYLKDGVIYLDNLKVEDCRFAALQSEWKKKKVVMKKCVFNNVEFDNHCGRGFLDIKECEFKNCTFHGMLGMGMFKVWASIFNNCIFEEFSTGGTLVSMIGRSRLFQCTFHNIDLKWSISIYKTEINGGKIEHSRIVKTSISESQFTHMQMEDVEIRGGYDENRMESVIFKNVVLRGSMGEESVNNQKNIFVDCDTEGFTFIKESLGLDSVMKL